MRWERKRAWQAVPLLLLLLTGCGSDRPVLQPPPQPHPMQADTPLTAVSTGTASTTPASSSPPDPLISESRQTRPDPLIGRDPLLGHDPQLGHAMPTQHSHWLRGHLRDARVTVLLNGVRHGSFSGTLDQDITMKLRQGANTVTFEYQPNSAGSAGDLEIVEGEHHPPLAPLVTFHGESDPTAGGVPGGALKPVTRTFPFVAN